MGESQLEALMSRGRRHSAQEALDHALSRVPKTSPASNGHSTPPLTVTGMGRPALDGALAAR